MTTLADYYVRARSDDRTLRSEVKSQGEKHGRVFGTTFARATAGPFRAVGGVLTRSIGGVVAGLGAVAGIRAFAGFIADAEESAKVSRLTASTIRATGKAAKVTAKQVGDLATAISNKTGKDDEAIQSGQNMLLTFKNIRNEAGKNNDIFNRASSVLTDMVAAMNQGNVTQENMSKGAVQLGKALNDPIKGIGALSRVGVTFTDQQKEQIKAMVEAGNVAGAQKIILAELSSEFGGAAEASSSMSDRMRVALGNLGEFIGGLLLPLVDKFARFVATKLVPGLQAMVAAFQGEGITSDGLVGFLERVGVMARKAFDYFKAQVLPRLGEFWKFLKDKVIPVLAKMADWMVENKDVVYGFVGAVIGAQAAMGAYELAINAAKGATVAYEVAVAAATVFTKGWTAATLGLNVAMKANVIGIIVLALVGLVALIIYAYKHSETFRQVVQAAWKGIQAAVDFAWNKVIKPAFEGIVWFIQRVLVPTSLWLWHNVIEPTWKGISWAVNAAWVTIQIIFKIIQAYIRSVLAPVFLWFWHTIIEPVFKGAGAAISAAWNKVIKPIFDLLGEHIKKNVVPPFKEGVRLIGEAWDALRKAAAVPVKFVIETVINKGIIGGINWVAKAVGVKDRIDPIPLPKGLGDGPGLPKGAGDGIGDLAKVFTGPAKFIADKAGIGRIRQRFGNNPLSSVVVGAANRVKDMAVDKVLSLLSVFDSGTGASIGKIAGSLSGLQPGISAVLADLRSVFGSVPVISGFRPGATTLSGNVSYHASGRAIDIAPVLRWAQYLRYFWGPRLKELITPWNDLNILNGAPHRYTGAVWNQHNFAGGNAHIHAAFDRGGFLLPGLNIVPNNTGRAEPVTTAATMEEQNALLRALIAAVERVAPGVAAELYGGATLLRQAARAR